MQNFINIVFATNQQYIQHLCAAIKSLLDNNKDSSFKIYIINSGISKNIYANILTVIKPYNCQLENIVISDNYFKELVLTHHYSKEIYYRLLIPELINEEKVLYLDADIIINGSIKGIYNQNIEDYYVCAVEDPFFDRYEELKIEKKFRYFNSGVMLINVMKWRNTDLHKKVINFVEKNFKILHFPDQDALNALIYGNWKRMPLKYNLTMILDNNYENKFSCFTKEELREAKNKPIIIHYTGGSKPWQLKNIHPYKNLYWKYLRMTPYRFSLPTELRPSNLFKSLIPKPVKKILKKIINL